MSFRILNLSTCSYDPEAGYAGVDTTEPIAPSRTTRNPRSEVRTSSWDLFSLFFCCEKKMDRLQLGKENRYREIRNETGIASRCRGANSWRGHVGPPALLLTVTGTRGRTAGRQHFPVSLPALSAAIWRVVVCRLQSIPRRQNRVGLGLATWSRWCTDYGDGAAGDDVLT